MIRIRTRLRVRASMDRHRWLERCAGFRVDGPGGRVGVVALVRTEAGRPVSLVVRAGPFVARRWIVVPIEEVVDIMPATRRVVVSAAVQRAARLRTRAEASGERAAATSRRARAG